MEPNQLFIIFYAFLFAYFARRRFDLFSYVFLSSSVYFMPAFFGFVHDGTMPLNLIPIRSELYFFYYFFFLVLLLFSVRAELRINMRRSVVWPEPAASLIDFNYFKSLRYLRMTRWLSAIFLALGYLSMRNVFFSENKQDFLDGQSIFFTVWQSTAVLYVILAFLQRKKLDILVGLLYCVVDLYVGFRGVAVYSLMSVLLLYAYKNNASKLNFAMVVSGGLLAFVLLTVYKQLILFVKIDDLQTGLNNFIDFNSYYAAFLTNEGFTQQAIFNAVLAKQFTIPADHLLSFFRVFLPGVGVFLFGKPVGFNDYFQPVLFRDVPWGMASNFWAEQYAMFGWLWLGLVTVLFFMAVDWSNRKLLKYALLNSNKKLCFTIFLVVPTLFLIHRNDLEFSLYLLRNSMFLLVFIFMLSEKRRWF